MHLLIRADASIHIGVGHLMRCLALAQAWQDTGGQVTFACTDIPPSLRRRLIKEKMGVTCFKSIPGSSDDAEKTIALAKNGNSDRVVADGYQFDESYQKRIRDAGLRLLIIDDFGHAGHYYADIVLNQNISADETLYQNREVDTCLLLGSRYVLLRREFRLSQRQKKNIPEYARKILVTMGGSDPDNVTRKVIDAISLLNNRQIEVNVVAGPSNFHVETLRESMRRTPCSMHCIENAENLLGLMAWADIAVSAGGSTCWELAFMGVPNITIVLAENQQPIADHLDKHSVSINLGWHESVTEIGISQILDKILPLKDKRTDMTEKGRALIDGKGASRVCDLLKDTKGCRTLPSLSLYQ